MALPQIAIVGRPNVGKSSMFNWLVGRRIAIVDPTPGVTRDRLTVPIQINERFVEITDTGGMGNEDRDNLTKDVERQIQYALDRAHVVLFVVDARTGPVPLDEMVASRLRGIDKPVLLVVNKTDFDGLDHQVGEFYKLGFGEPYRVSAQQRRGRGTLFEAIAKSLPPESEDFSPPRDDVPLKLAIVGRRNTGKSTFINALAKEERTIVSEVEGTTRDSVDVSFERDGKTITAIDTAGVRYRGKIQDDIEFYSLARAEKSIRRADIVLHFLDATKKISLVDKQLSGYVLEHYKPCIFVVNKWDLMKEELATGDFGDYIRRTFPSLDFVPIAFVTAKDGRNIDPVLHLARNLYKQTSVRVTTGELNRVLQRAMFDQNPPVRQKRMPKLYYATQVACNPPTIVMFTNGDDMFDKTYQRYLMKNLRDHFPFKDVPVKLYFRYRPKEVENEERATEEGTKKKVISKSRKKSKKSKDVGDLWTDV